MITLTGRNGKRGFTVTELLVAVALMSLIVLALYSMFNQTQRALRANESQIDSTERGRGVMEIVSRELEQARVSLRTNVNNFWVRMAADSSLTFTDALSGGVPDTNSVPKINSMDFVYFNTKFERAWKGVGYAVLLPTNTAANTEALIQATAGLGNLYRYETKETNREYYFASTNLWSDFLTNLPSFLPSSQKAPGATNYSLVAEGVVHFKVSPYDTQGRLMSYIVPPGATNLDSTYRIARLDLGGNLFPYPLSNVSQQELGQANVILQQGSPIGLDTIAAFRNNVLPAYLELELGVMEPDVYRQYKQFISDGQPDKAQQYLSRRLAKVQIFRKRIPLRTVAQ